MYVNLTYEGFINVSRSINKCNLEVDIYELHPLNLIAPLAKIPYYIALFFHILSTMHLFCLLKETNMQHLFSYDYLLRYHFYKEVRGNFWKFDSSLAMNFFFIHFFPRQIKLSKKKMELGRE